VLATEAELGVVVAFGRIIRPHVLAELPMVNLHFSLLPRWRGAAPVERALLAGDDVTGVCVMAVEEGLDTGGVYAVERGADRSATTADESATHAGRGREPTARRHARRRARRARTAAGGTHLRRQDRSVRELRIDWAAPAEQIDRLIRLGGAWTTFRGAGCKIHEARVEDGELVPVVVQPEGKPPMAYDAWRNGARPSDGEWFE
jgi:methionyl-tRNA formyltransferase